VHVAHLCHTYDATLGSPFSDGFLGQSGFLEPPKV
jgi:hypothetical protein